MTQINNAYLSVEQLMDTLGVTTVSLYMCAFRFTDIHNQR